MMTDTPSLIEYLDAYQGNDQLLNILPDRIKVVIEPYSKSENKNKCKKFVVPKYISIEAFVEESSRYILPTYNISNRNILQRYTLVQFYVRDSNPLICLFPWCYDVKYVPIPPKTTMNDVYNQSGDNDGILYLKYRVMD